MSLLVGIGCMDLSGSGSTAPDSGLVVKDGLRLRWQGGLPLRPEPAAAHPAYERARGLWRTATTSFSIGAYDDSGREFIAVAEALPTKTASDATSRAARCLAYENAAAAFAGANDVRAGIDALAQARIADPGCHHSITRVLDRLSTRTGTAAPAAPPLAPTATPTAPQ